MPRSRSTSSIRSHSGSISAQPSSAWARTAGSASAGWSSCDGRGDVVAPGRHGDGDALGVARLDGEAEPFQRRDRLVRRHVRAAQAPRGARSAARRSAASAGSRPAETTALGSPPQRSRIMRVAASSAAGGSAGSMPRSKRWRASDTIWCRRPVRAIRTGSNSAHSTNTRGRVLVAAGRLAAHDARQRLHAACVGDHAILRRHGVVAAVERAEGLARAGAHGQHAAGDAVGVEHVQRAAEVDREEVGDIDERVDRPQPDRGQPVSQPLRARPVAQVADGAAEHPGARLGPLDPPCERAREPALHRLGMPRTQRADTGGREIARDAAHGEGVAPVRRDGDLDHRIVEAEPRPRTARRPARPPAVR